MKSFCVVSVSSSETDREGDKKSDYENDAFVCPCLANCENIDTKCGAEPRWEMAEQEQNACQNVATFCRLFSRVFRLVASDFLSSTDCATDKMFCLILTIYFIKFSYLIIHHWDYRRMEFNICFKSKHQRLWNLNDLHSSWLLSGTEIDIWGLGRKQAAVVQFSQFGFEFVDKIRLGYERWKCLMCSFTAPISN